MKLKWLFLFVLIPNLGIFCANPFFNIGFGNYDGFFLGYGHSFKRFNLEYHLGNDFNIYDQGNLIDFNITLSKQVLKKTIKNNFTASVGLKNHVWQLENKSNLFRAIALNPEINIICRRNSKLGISLFAGPIWSTVFQYERKGYQNVGFPKEWQANFGLNILYFLDEK